MGHVCLEAGVSDAIAFATRLELAKRMFKLAITAGVPTKWFVDTNEKLIIDVAKRNKELP